MSAILQWFERFLALTFFGIGIKTDLFQSCGHCWVFHICWHIECSTFTASSVRIWNSSLEFHHSISFVVMLPTAHLTSHSSMSGSRWVFSLVQLLSHVWLFGTQWTAAKQASLSTTNSQSLLKVMFIESVMPSNHLVLCHSLLLLSSIFPSIRTFPMSQFFTSGGPSIGASASLLVLPRNIQGWSHLELTGFWFDLLAVQGTLKSLLQHHSSKASILRSSVFFMVQVSHAYTTTGKTTTLTRWTFIGKVISLPFNMLSRLVIAFLPRNKSLNIMAAVTICSDFGDQENKVCHCFHCFPLSLP